MPNTATHPGGWRALGNRPARVARLEKDVPLPCLDAALAYLFQLGVAPLPQPLHQVHPPLHARMVREVNVNSSATTTFDASRVV